MEVDTVGFGEVGNRGSDVWDGEPEGIYVPTDMPAQMICISNNCEVFVAGARYEGWPFVVNKNEIDVVQYGSDDTKTHRKIDIFWVRNKRTRLAVCWSQSFIQLERVAGRAFRLTNMTQIVSRMKPAMMRW